MLGRRLAHGGLARLLVLRAAREGNVQSTVLAERERELRQVRAKLDEAELSVRLGAGWSRHDPPCVGADDGARSSCHVAVRQVNDLQRKLTAAEESLTEKQREVVSLRSERTAHKRLCRPKRVAVSRSETNHVRGLRSVFASSRAVNLVSQDKVAMLDGLKQQLEAEVQEKVRRAVPPAPVTAATHPTGLLGRPLPDATPRWHRRAT